MMLTMSSVEEMMVPWQETFDFPAPVAKAAGNRAQTKMKTVRHSRLFAPRDLIWRLRSAKSGAIANTSRQLSRTLSSPQRQTQAGPRNRRGVACLRIERDREQRLSREINSRLAPHS